MELKNELTNELTNETEKTLLKLRKEIKHLKVKKDDVKNLFLTSGGIHDWRVDFIHNCLPYNLENLIIYAYSGKKHELNLPPNLKNLVVGFIDDANNYEEAKQYFKLPFGCTFYYHYNGNHEYLLNTFIDLVRELNLRFLCSFYSKYYHYRNNGFYNILKDENYYKLDDNLNDDKNVVLYFKIQHDKIFK